MLILPIVELRIIRTLVDYLNELESSESFPNECVKKIAHAVFGSSRLRLKETVNCYIINHRKSLAKKIRDGDFTTILVDPHVDWDEKKVAASQKKNQNNPNGVNSPARKSCVRHRQAGRRAKLQALSRRQSNQPKTVTPANAKSNNKDRKKDASIDLIEQGKDSTQFSDVLSTKSRLSNSFPPESRCTEKSDSTSSSSDESFLGFSKDMIDAAPFKLKAFYKNHLDDMSQQSLPALLPSSNRLIMGPSEEFGRNNIHEDRLLLNVSDRELPKEEAYHTEYMIPDDFCQPPPPALTLSSSGLITPFSEEMSHDSLNGDRTLMTTFEIPKEEACHTDYRLLDTSFQSKHIVMNNATNQARKAKLYSELATLVQRTHHAEMEISRWENIRLQLRAQQRKKEQELKGLLQHEQQEDS